MYVLHQDHAQEIQIVEFRIDLRFSPYSVIYFHPAKLKKSILNINHSIMLIEKGQQKLEEEG